MSAPVTVQGVADGQWPGRGLLDGARGRVVALLREVLHRCLWAPTLTLWAGRRRGEGAPPGAPVVYVANHASHADTIAIRQAVGAAGRRRLAVAAAEDYFFPTTGRALVVTAALGAFPFPRHGDAGLRRADALLRSGWSVLLYPQGTRSAGADFRAGVLRLAAAGWPLVPVGIAGTDHLLPKGARWPRRHRVAVVIGTPLTPAQIAGDLAVVIAAVEAARARAHTVVLG